MAISVLAAAILKSSQYSILPAPRFCTTRRNPGRFVADARADAAATALRAGMRDGSLFPAQAF